MKHKLSLFLLVPLTVLSCSTGDHGFSVVKGLIDQIEVSDKHPYYRVVGVLDFNNSYTEVDSTFDKLPNGNIFVPYARYNEGFYSKYAESLSEDDDIKIYAMASHSYWLRAPLKIDKENFFALNEEGSENISTANYQLTHIITAWIDAVGSANPSSCYTYYETLSNGGFAIGGNSVHTKLFIDNYPCYPSGADCEFGEWIARDPLPAFKNSVDGKFNIRFEYDKDGWLKSESFASINYNPSSSISTQTAGESRYYYQNGSETW